MKNASVKRLGLLLNEVVSNKKSSWKFLIQDLNCFVVKWKDAGLKHSSMTRSHAGFTLIELLVVVLVIGILAAVALPKYQTAVDKALFARMIPLVRAVKTELDVINMAHGEMGNTLKDVPGIEKILPAGYTWRADSKSAIWSDKGLELAREGVSVWAGLYSGNFGSGNLVASYVVYLDSSGRGQERQCFVYSSNRFRGERLCKSLGGVNPAPGGDGSVSVYSLP